MFGYLVRRIATSLAILFAVSFGIIPENGKQLVMSPR